jgi:hypothetical protein
MSHTKRIYNNSRLKKAQRYNLDDMDDIHPSLGCHIISPIGIPFTRRSWICMGHCPMCRDHNREPKLLRKRNKEEFRLRLREEL